MKQLFRENVGLAPLTTLKIGGPARYFIEADSETAIAEAVQTSKERNLPVFILGGGSNLLVADGGFPGLVIKVGVSGLEWETGGDTVIVCAGAAEDWDRLAGLCVERGLGGVECLSGIPGSVGGTPVQNVAAYGQEISGVLVSLRAYDRYTDRVVELSRDQCRFSYRTSLFNTTAKDRYIVLRVTYALGKGVPPTLHYPDVERFFYGKSQEPSLVEVRAAVRQIRASKSMLLVAGDPDCRSAGSFFKNPIVSLDRFAVLETAAEKAGILGSGERVPQYPVSPGNVKTAAAWLIERAGFSKGYSSGTAALSSKHALALVNKGGATADDLLKLAREIRLRVEDVFGIRLFPEPIFAGFDERIISEFFGQAD